MAKKDFAAFMENGICRLQELCRELAGQPVAIREKEDYEAQAGCIKAL